MMKMKLNKKIAGASAMLLLSATMLGTSTFAWFTMNKEVTVTGMEMKTKVGSNLLICETNDEADFTNDLVQARKALLEPASTVKAVDGSFYYTVNAKADGDAVEDVYKLYEEKTVSNATCAQAGKSNYDVTFNNEYTLPHSGTDYDTGYAYVDYNFYIKATSDKADQELRLTECNLIYNNAVITNSATGSGATTDNDLAWRVALFSEEITANGGKGATAVSSVNPTASDATPKVILRRTGSQNQTDPKVVDSATTVNGTASYNTWAGGNAYVDKFTSVGTKYYKITARVWLEGEDKSCKSSTYALLTNAYELGLQFELVDQGTAGDSASVTELGSSTTNDTGKIMTSGT